MAAFAIIDVTRLYQYFSSIKMKFPILKVAAFSNLSSVL